MRVEVGSVKINGSDNSRARCKQTTFHVIEAVATTRCEYDFTTTADAHSDLAADVAASTEQEHNPGVIHALHPGRGEWC